MHLEIDLENLENPRLSPRVSAISSREEYRTQVPRWNFRWQGSQIDLIARPRELAALATQEFFASFGLNSMPKVLRIFQQDIAR